MTRVREYGTLAAPLMVKGEDGEPIVILAFGLSAGLRSGRMIALCIGLSGGHTWWEPVDRLVFPSPIQTRSSDPGSTIPGKPVRANAGKTVKAVLQ